MPEQCVRKCPEATCLFKFPSEVEMQRRLMWMSLLAVSKRPEMKELMLFACDKHFSPKYLHLRRLSKEAIPDVNLAVRNMGTQTDDYLSADSPRKRKLKAVIAKKTAEKEELEKLILIKTQLIQKLESQKINR